MEPRTKQLSIYSISALSLAIAVIAWLPFRSATAQQPSTISGQVSEFSPATAISAGLISIGGAQYAIAPGTVFKSQELITAGAYLSIRAVMNSEGQLIAISSVESQGTETISVCGKVSGFLPATDWTAGSLVLNSKTYAIAPGVKLKGELQLSPDADVCLTAAVDFSGQITFLNSVAPSAQSSNTVCGTVTSFNPATSTNPGSITIGGMSFTIAAGVTLPGVGLGANLCLNLCIDSNGRIVGISNLPGATVTTGSICGQVTAFKRALGGIRGSISIGSITFPIAPGLVLQGQNLAIPGAFICLSPVISGGMLVQGTVISEGTPGPLQFRTSAVVEGETFPQFGFGPSPDLFLMPDPVMFTASGIVPGGTSVFPVNNSTFGIFHPLGGRTIQGLSLSTPNSTVRTFTCADSFWDVIFEIAGLGATDGDMVTFKLQNPDGSNSQLLAMFTLYNNAAELTQLHNDVTFFFNGFQKPRGYISPLMVAGGSSGLRTPQLILAFSMNPSSPLNGCFQLVAEIKRGYGAGKTSLVISHVQLKRLERPDDRGLSVDVGLNSSVQGWFPTGLPCGFICNGCNVIPVQNASLSGVVFCDKNNDGIQQSDEVGLANVTITLSGAMNKTTKTNSNGAYSFSGLPPGVYKITETQPSGVGDGKDTVGSLGGDLSNDMVSNIVMPMNGTGTGYNFGEICATQKCDTICWRSTQHFLNNFRHLPGGAILIPGVNFNNPVSIQGNLNAVRIALQGGFSPMQKLSKEFVTAQLSLAGAGGTASPVVFNTYWSPLRCSGVRFNEITLSTGFKLTQESLLNDLVDQTTLAIKNNRSQDYAALAGIWALLNGRC
jgi:hypothetical protein